MKRRDLLKGILLGTGVAAASSASVAGTSYQFHQRVPGIKPVTQMGGGSDPVMQDASPQDRTGIPSTGDVLAQDGGVEWYGEVPTSELITGNALAAAFGFNRGHSERKSGPNEAYYIRYVLLCHGTGIQAGESCSGSKQAG